MARAGGASADLQIAGTDLLGVAFSRALHAHAGRHDLTLALAFDGSRPGIDRLKDGRAHLAIFVLPPGEDRELNGFECLPLGYHRIVVLVPPAAPLAHVSLDQLGGIFGAGGPVSVMRWGELGDAGDWSGSMIVPHAPVAGIGIAAEYFRHTVLHGREFKSAVARYDSPAELAAQLAGDSRVIALAHAPLPQAGVAKVVPVARRHGEPAYLPTPENLHSDDYPLRLPLRVAFRRESVATLRPLLSFLFSDELAPLLEHAGVVPLPTAERRRQVAALDKL